jgi:hypothetical protein
LTTQVCKGTQLKCTFPKIEKYIKIFARELPIFRVPKKQHIFLHTTLCNNLFSKWEKFNQENVKELIPSSPEG